MTAEGKGAGRSRAPGAPLTVLIAGGGTGGHLMPALAIAAGLRQAHPDWRVVLAGAHRGIEAELLPARDFPYHLLHAEPLYRRQWWKNLKWPILAFRLLREVNRVLDAERPAVVVGTGGYASGPVVWRAARRGIPTAMLELNAFPGLAARKLAGSVREIWLGSPEARRHLRPGQGTEVVDTGTPITPPDPALRAEALRRFGFNPGRPVLLVTGGSQGSLALNGVVAKWIESGDPGMPQVLWAAGRTTFERFRDMHRPPDVQVYPFLDPIGPAYSVADLALTRAGMMTLAELCAWGVPAIVVPLPSAAADHQTPNAEAVHAAGAAVFASQAELTASRLGELVTSLLSDPRRLAAMRSAALARARPEATGRIVDRIGVLSG